MMKKPIAAITLASMIPVTSAAAVLAATVIERAEPERARAGRGRGRDGVARPVREQARLAPAIVGIDDLLRRAADGLDHPPPLVMERPRLVVVGAARHGGLTDDAVLELAAPIGEVTRDPLPLPEVLVDDPVDQLVDALLDLLRRVGDDLALETFLHARAIQQIHHPPDPHGVVEVVVPAPLHLEQHVVHRGHPSFELTRHVRLEHAELALDVFEQHEVGLQRGQPLLRRRRVAIDQRRADAERVQQLQPHPRRRVERACGCSARAPRTRWRTTTAARRSWRGTPPWR